MCKTIQLLTFVLLIALGTQQTSATLPATTNGCGSPESANKVGLSIDEPDNPAANGYPEQLYIWGEFNGWDNRDGTYVLRPVSGQDGVYEGTYSINSIAYPAPEFKLGVELGDWSVSYGGSDGSNLISTVNTEYAISTTGGNLMFNLPFGDYTFHVDLSTGKIKVLIPSTQETGSITVFVKADVAPYLYVWGGADNGGWPGTRMTEQQVKNGVTYWAKTFNCNSLNLIFNSGNSGYGYQTGDFTNITEDCMFIYDGASFAYGVLPGEAFGNESGMYLFYVNTDHWSNVYVSMTNGSQSSRQLMTRVGKDRAGFDVYKWESEALSFTPTSVAFNDGSSSNTTPSATFSNGGYYVYTFFANKSYQLLDCVAVIDPSDDSQRPHLNDLSIDYSGITAADWNDLNKAKTIGLSGSYFSGPDRNAEIVYSIDSQDWRTAVKDVKSEDTFNTTITMAISRQRYDITGIDGDVNGNGNVNSYDLEILRDAILAGSTESVYDLNGDGIVDGTDYILLYMIVNGENSVGRGPKVPAADVDGNGIIDGNDVICIWKYLMGYEVESASMDLNYDGNINALDIAIVLNSIDTSSGSQSTSQVHTLRVAARDISGAFSSITQHTYYTIGLLEFKTGAVTYNGEAIVLSNAQMETPDGTLYNQDEHFALNDYQNNVNAGTATVQASGLPGGCIGSAQFGFTINAAPLAGEIVLTTDDPAFVYNGQPHRPAVKVVHSQFGELTAETDYTLSYSNNTYPGSAAVTATGQGNFTGRLTTGFVIDKAVFAPVMVAVTVDEDILYDGEPHVATVRSACTGLGSITVYYVNGSQVASTEAPIDPGTYTVNVEVAEGDYVYGGTITQAATLTINAVDANDWASLKRLYNATDGESSWITKWDLSNVKNAASLVPLVTFDKGRVKALNLKNNGLAGDLSIDGLRFENVESVDISDNDLSGNIGAFATAFPALVSLKASGNHIGEVSPVIPSRVATLELNRQTLSTPIALSVKDLNDSDLAHMLPTIATYNHDSQDYSNLFLLVETGEEDPNPFGMFFDGQEWFSAEAFFGRDNVGNHYHGAVNDVLTTDFGRGSFPMRLSFDSGDSNFDGGVNVLDLQTMLNDIFGEFPWQSVFNFTAANINGDQTINVQDIVGEVNLLLAQTPAAAPAHMSARRGPVVTTATVYWHNGGLYLNCDEPIAALDLTFDYAGTIKWDVERFGMTASCRADGTGTHAVIYSLVDGAIPAGETLLATIAGSSAQPQIGYVMLSNRQARPVAVTANRIVTSVERVGAASPSAKMVNGRLDLTAVDGDHVAVYSLDGRVVCSRSLTEETRMVEMPGLVDSQCYIVTVTRNGNLVYSTKVINQ